MIIYYLLIILIGMVSIITINNRNVNRRNKIVVIISSVAIVLVQGLRSPYVGIDLFKPGGYLPALRMAQYMDFFNGDKLFNFEIGYSLFTQAFSKLNVSDQFYLFVLAISIIAPIAYIIYKYSKSVGLSIFIYITLGFFTFSFSGIRQAIAMAITFFSFKYVRERKLSKFLLLILLATTFHFSAIIFIFAYTLYRIKIKDIHIILMLPFTAFIYIKKVEIFLFFYKFYKGYLGQIENTGAHTMFLVMIFVFVISCIFENKKTFNADYNAYKNYLLVAIFVQSFASLSSTIMRLGHYYFLFIILLIPEVIKTQKDKHVRAVAVGILCLALLYFFQMTTGSGSLNVSPYYFFWER